MQLVEYTECNPHLLAIALRYTAVDTTGLKPHHYRDAGYPSQ
jgi:hypothetical protein